MSLYTSDHTLCLQADTNTSIVNNKQENVKNDKEINVWKFNKRK